MATLTAARRPAPFRLLVRPLALVWRQRVLLRRMTWREISSRYRESVLGTMWTSTFGISCRRSTR